MKIKINKHSFEDGSYQRQSEEFRNELKKVANLESRLETRRPRAIEFDPAIGGLNEYVTVSLGVAGITAFYKFLCKWLERHKHRSIVLYMGDKRLKITGHNQKEELEHLKTIASEKE